MRTLFNCKLKRHILEIVFSWKKIFVQVLMPAFLFYKYDHETKINSIKS